MQPAATSGSSRRSPLEGLLVVLSLLLWPMAALHRLVADDFWWHLGVARWIVETGRIPVREMASWTAQGVPWYDYEWLWQLAMLGLWRFGGGTAVVLSTAILALLTGILLYLALREAGAEPALAAAFLWPAVFVARLRFQARPEMPTLVLLALTLFLVLRLRRTGRSGALWWLVPATALWVNLHPGFLFGLGILGLALAGEVVEWVRHRSSPGEAGDAGARILVLARVGLACGLASLLSPRPLGPHLLVLESFTGFRAVGLRNVEWEPMPFAWDAMPFWLLLLGTALLLVVDLPRVHAADLLWLAAFGLLAVQTQRSAALLALVAPPVAARSLRHLQPEPLGARMGTRRRALLHGTLAVAALPLLLAAHRTPVGPSGLGVSWGRVPVEAASFVEREEILGRMFNHYRLGGWLGYRLAPDRLVFADGKHIPYLETLGALEAALAEGYPAFQRFLRERGVEVAVLHYEEPLQPVVYGVDPETGRPRRDHRAWSTVWFHAKDWALVHWDDTAMVKVRRFGPNLGLARRREVRRLDPADWRHQLREVGAGRLEVGPLLEDLDRKLEEDPGSNRARLLREAFLAAAEPPSEGIRPPAPQSGEGSSAAP